MERNYDLVQVTGALADRASAGWCGVSTMVPALQGWFAFYPRQVAYRDTRWSEVLSGAAPTVGITVCAPPRSR